MNIHYVLKLKIYFNFMHHMGILVGQEEGLVRGKVGQGKIDQGESWSGEGWPGGRSVREGLVRRKVWSGEG